MNYILMNNGRFFDEVLGGKEYAVLLNGDSEKDIDTILELCEKAIDPKNVLSEYKAVFDEYYNAELHTKRISEFLANYWSL